MHPVLHLITEEPVPVPGAETAVFALSAPIVTLLISTVIPFLIALGTRWTTSSKLKAALLIVLNAVSVAITTAVTVDGDAVFSNQALLTFVIGTVWSVTTYYTGWRPFGVSSSTPGKFSGSGTKVDPAFVQPERAAA